MDRLMSKAIFRAEAFSGAAARQQSRIGRRRAVQYRAAHACRQIDLFH
jgi:hypothetical protein